MFKIIFGIVLLVVECNSNRDAGPTAGNDFIFAYFANIQPVNLYFMVSNANAASATIYVSSIFPFFDGFQTTVPGRTVVKIPITPISIQTLLANNATNTVVVEDRGIRLQSDQPVNVYATSGDFPNSDTHLVLPTSLLGMRYLAASAALNANNYNNMVTVIAYVDNTQITINNIDYTLNSLQTASIQSYTSLSGLLITGSRPFAVISGCMSGWTLATDTGGYESMMLRPTSDWNTVYTSIPFRYLTTNRYLVVSDTAANVVTYPGGVILLNAGEYNVINAPIGEITSTSPIQIIQLGQNTGTTQSNLGDAFFLPIPTLSQLSNQTVYFMPCGAFSNNQQALHHFVRIITIANYIGQIFIDNLSINSQLWNNVPNTQMYYYEQLISSNTHYIQSIDGAMFAVITYSYSFNCGCGYLAIAQN